MQFGFNSGAAFSIGPTANPTPNQLGILQSSSLSMKFTNKKLMGNNLYPVAAGRSQGDVTGKVDFAQYRSRLFADFSGGSMTGGQTLISYNEAGSVPGSSTYTIQVTNHTTFTLDLGVVYTNTGIPLVNVASSPAVGQYSYSAGTYTFATADANAAVQITYEYTTTGGDTITINNTSAGAASLHQLVLGMQYNGLQGNFNLPACLFTDMDPLDSKLGDFSKPKISYDAICNAAGLLATVSLAEVS